jgi:hypothetical protein
VRIISFVVLSLLPPILIGLLLWEGRQAPPVEHAAVVKTTGQDADGALRGLFEPAPAGTKTKEKVALYDEKGLFDYIDGAAPIFIERHFRKLAASELATPEGSDLVCDVYDMVAPENAQSIFDKEKSSQAKPVDGWPEAISGPMSFVFHHARYYAKLTAFDAKAEAMLPAVARALKERMAGLKAPAGEHTAVAPGQDADGALRGLFEPAPAGTKIKEKVALYDEKGLFDYIDGAAPIFIERGYRKLAASELATPEGSDLVCDVYDMAKPENAQSIFDKEKSSQAKPVDGWPEAISGPMSFVFHHARYYAKLTAFDAKAEAMLPAVARALKERMR